MAHSFNSGVPVKAEPCHLEVAKRLEYASCGILLWEVVKYTDCALALDISY